MLAYTYHPSRRIQSTEMETRGRKTIHLIFVCLLFLSQTIRSICVSAWHGTRCYRDNNYMYIRIILDLLYLRRHDNVDVIRNCILLHSVYGIAGSTIVDGCLPHLIAGKMASFRTHSALFM